MKPAVRRLLGGVIVSCKAGKGNPLHGPENMKRMAMCALMGGADGIRACWPQDVAAIRAVCDKPIVGINKLTCSANILDAVYITPTVQAATEVIEAGADVVALDCTLRPDRSQEALRTLLTQLRERHPDVAIMADLATEEEARFIDSTGLVDILSTTLAGYTRQSLGAIANGPSIQLIRAIKRTCKLPINAEGSIHEREDLRAVLEAGADMVTIGSAITMPWEITRRFCVENRSSSRRRF